MSKKSDLAKPMPFMARPAVGSFLTILAALTFYFLLMILPLVGPAAMLGSGSPGAGPAPHLKQNIVAFVATAIVGIAFSMLAIKSKLSRREIDGSPLPWYSIGMCAFGFLMLMGLALGLFKL